MQPDQPPLETLIMNTGQRAFLTFLALSVAALAASVPAAAQQSSKPNILFIMADDIGWMQVQLYADGLGVGETPNIDRIGKEGLF
jgi:arylsulfatase